MTFENCWEHITTNKICCHPRKPLPKVGRKENSFIIEEALSQNVMCITGSSLRVAKTEKPHPLIQTSGCSTHYTRVLEVNSS